MPDGTVCECGGWVDYSDLGSVAYHEHNGRGEPWGIKGVKVERKKYRMREEDHATLMEACKPVAMIALQCGPIRSPQKNANDAWQRLGKKMGFEHMTVEPDGADTRNFTAVTTASAQADA